MRRLPAILVTLLTVLAGLAEPGYAHPHAWIDLSVVVEFDEEGRVVGLRQTWLLDEFYTAYAAQGRDKDGDGVPEQAELEELLAVNLGNLREYAYFTHVSNARGAVAFGEIADTATRMVGRRLEMSFYLPFAEPVAVHGTELSYAIYDPTYFIEVLHADFDLPIEMRAAPPHCNASMKRPNPDAETVSFAAALDRSQTAGDGLGVVFAETVTIRCD